MFTIILINVIIKDYIKVTSSNPRMVPSSNHSDWWQPHRLQATHYHDQGWNVSIDWYSANFDCIFFSTSGILVAKSCCSNGSSLILYKQPSPHLATASMRCELLGDRVWSRPASLWYVSNEDLVVSTDYSIFSNRNVDSRWGEVLSWDQWPHIQTINRRQFSFRCSLICRVVTS